MNFNGKVIEVHEPDEHGIRWAVVKTSKGGKREWIVMPERAEFQPGERVRIRNRAGEPLTLESR